MLGLHRLQIPFEDSARKFDRLDVSVAETLKPFPHQKAALDAWEKAGKVGVVEMPTGAGKTILGALAIAAAGRPALVVVPTLELLHQWKKTLETFLRGPGAESNSND